MSHQGLQGYWLKKWQEGWPKKFGYGSKFKYQFKQFVDHKNWGHILLFGFIFWVQQIWASSPHVVLRSTFFSKLVSKIQNHPKTFFSLFETEPATQLVFAR